MRMRATRWLPGRTGPRHCRETGRSPLVVGERRSKLNSTYVFFTLSHTHPPLLLTAAKLARPTCGLLWLQRLDLLLKRLKHRVHGQVLEAQCVVGRPHVAQVDDVQVERVHRAVRVCRSRELASGVPQSIGRLGAAHSNENRGRCPRAFPARPPSGTTPLARRPAARTRTPPPASSAGTLWRQ